MASIEEMYAELSVMTSEVNNLADAWKEAQEATEMAREYRMSLPSDTYEEKMAINDAIDDWIACQSAEEEAESAWREASDQAQEMYDIIQELK
jgi:hypothetical protein